MFSFVLRINVSGFRLLNLTQPAHMSLLINGTWAVANLCRLRPGPDLHLVQPTILPLVALLHRDNVTTDVLANGVWALSYLSTGNKEHIQRVLETGVTERLISFLKDKGSKLLTPTVRCLGNFVTGSESQTQTVLDAGLLKHMNGLLEHPLVSHLFQLRF